MYLLINPDKTMNTVGEHPIDKALLTQALLLVEFPEKTIADVMGNISIDEALWDADKQQVVRHPLFDPGSEAWRRLKAGQHINQSYPLWKQVNLLRSGDKSAMKKMALFIDKCRKWSNDLSIDKALINRIEP